MSRHIPVLHLCSLYLNLEHTGEWFLAWHGNKPPNGLPFSRRERAGSSLQKSTISRAKRSVAWACSAAAVDTTLNMDQYLS